MAGTISRRSLGIVIMSFRRGRLVVVWMMDVVLLHFIGGGALFDNRGF